MRTIPLDGDLRGRVASTLAQSPMFHGLPTESMEKVVAHATLVQLESGEVLVKQGDPCDAMYVILKGEAAVTIHERRSGEPVQLCTLHPPDTVGETGLLLNEPRSASVIARGPLVAVAFPSAAFQAMFRKIPPFGISIARSLARRLVNASRDVHLPEWKDDASAPSPETLALLPVDFLQRHRVVPLVVKGTSLTLGFVDTPDSATLKGARQLLPSLEIAPVHIRASVFDEVMKSKGPSIASWSDGGDGDDTTNASSVAPGAGAATDRRGWGIAPGGEGSPLEREHSIAMDSVRHASPKLDQLLRRMVAEGASDLHLSARHKPRWRIDGAVREIGDAPILGPDDVYKLLEGAMDERSRASMEDNDADFAYPLEGVARFRVNMFRDHLGVGAVMRVIPAKILTFEQLGLPPVVAALCKQPKGLVLVTGPTGSGKSTTLASMVDAINRDRRDHVITLEDPIEFVHKSQGCLVNQREVGGHTKSFGRALKAALREDPDIVLVGEMRDLETVSLALETANTGHLVFGTLHTSTAISTIDRIINLFMPEQQSQIRATLADTLRGVVAQTLCKKIGGGRVAALEILVVNHAVSNLIREGKSHQIPSIMSTGRGLGNQMLDDELHRLVTKGVVAFEEALTKCADKGDLAKKCGKDATERKGPASPLA